MNRDAAIWVDPCRQGGTPCVNGTRIPTSSIAETVFYHGFNEAFRCWPDLTDREVLVACWFEAETRARTKLGKAWKQWAEDAHPFLWHYNGPLPELPPTLAGDQP